MNLFGEVPQEEEEQNIPWDAYPRSVLLMFSLKDFNEFQKCVEKLAGSYGTKNPTDTLLEAVRRLTRVRFTAQDNICPDCDGTKDICSIEEGSCPKHAKNSTG
jgi:hypothetical protein